MAYYLIVEGLKASAGDDYAKRRNEFERALRPKDRAKVAEPVAPLPNRLQQMQRPSWWDDSDDPLEGMPGRVV